MEIPETQPTQLEVAISLGTELTKLRQQIEDKEADLARLKESFKHIEEQLLPDIFEALEIQEIRLQSGIKIRLNVFPVGRISEDKRQAAFEWLTRNNLDAIVKNKIDISLDRGAQDMADLVVNWCAAQGVPYKIKEDIHHQTLKAFLKEQNDNPDFPRDLFNVHEVKQVKFVA